MGVKGLWSFITREAGLSNISQRCVIESQDTVIIDASALVYDLCYRTKQSVFAADYGELQAHTEDFCRIFLRARVTCVFVFDGHTPVDKLMCKLQRMKRQAHALHALESGHAPDADASMTIPLLAAAAVARGAEKCNFECIQAIGEADETVARLANKYSAYVLSNDSDLLVFNGGIGLILLTNGWSVDDHGNIVAQVLRATEVAAYLQLPSSVEEECMQSMRLLAATAGFDLSSGTCAGEGGALRLQGLRRAVTDSLKRAMAIPSDCAAYTQQLQQSTDSCIKGGSGASKKLSKSQLKRPTRSKGKRKEHTHAMQELEQTSRICADGLVRSETLLPMSHTATAAAAAAGNTSPVYLSLLAALNVSESRLNRVLASYGNGAHAGSGTSGTSGRAGAGTGIGSGMTAVDTLRRAAAYIKAAAELTKVTKSWHGAQEKEGRGESDFDLVPALVALLLAAPLSEVKKTLDQHHIVHTLARPVQVLAQELRRALEYYSLAPVVDPTRPPVSACCDPSLHIRGIASDPESPIILNSCFVSASARADADADANVAAATCASKLSAELQQVCLTGLFVHPLGPSISPEKEEFFARLRSGVYKMLEMPHMSVTEVCRSGCMLTLQKQRLLRRPYAVDEIDHVNETGAQSIFECTEWEAMTGTPPIMNLSNRECVLYYFSRALRSAASATSTVYAEGKSLKTEAKIGSETEKGANYAVAAAALVLSGRPPPPPSSSQLFYSGAPEIADLQPISKRELTQWVLLERAVLHCRYLFQARSTVQGEKTAIDANTDTDTDILLSLPAPALIDSFAHQHLADDICFDHFSAHAYSRALRVQENAGSPSM